MTLLRHALVTLVLAGGAVAAASRIEVAAQKPYDVSVVPPSSVVRWLSLGHPTLAANLLWLRTVQYIGEPRSEERGWDKLLPLLDTITDLDPGHGYAYQVGGVVLGSAGHTRESNAILEKGIKGAPDRYILPYLRAFNAFYYDDDWKTAGHFAEISARTPGAPPHVRQNVLAYYVKGKRADAAVAFLEQSLLEAKDPDTRKAVESQLLQARLEQAVARLDDAAVEWRRRYFTGPLALGQLVEEGLVPRIPPDPAGGELYLGEDGRVRSTANPYRVGRPEKAREASPEPGMGRRQAAGAP
jgi:tetratricopeptide (TPR) repeat protein